MAVEFGTGKTIFILAIVVGCFAVLWPKLFYPMLQASVNPKTPIDNSQASTCCDVIFETDVNIIKIIVEMCGNVHYHHYEHIDPKLILAFQEGRLSKEVVEACRNEVLNKCGVDITAFLNEKVRLGKTYKQILDDIRSFNHSVCLKRNFGVARGELGAPRRMRIGALSTPSHHRQERPPHLRPDMLHPALRERGRAIPQSHIVPRVIEKEGRPGPIPGMRPPMGGAGHVVPAPKGSGTMGIVMPIYTIGIVVFFMYTVMKVMFKKPGQSSVSYGEFSPDPDFRKMVFSEEYIEDRTNSYGDQIRHKPKRETTSTENGTKLGWKERDARDIEIDQLRKRLEETEAAMERIVAQMGSVPLKLHSSSGTDLIGAKEEVVPEKTKEKENEIQQVSKKEDQKEDTVSIEGSGKALKEDTETVSSARSQVQEEEKKQEQEAEYQHMNDAEYEDNHSTTNNFTTASAAAEATSTSGPEETAADYSTLESFDQNDDQQEEEVLEDEEVWNGDVNLADEEERAGEPQEILQIPQRQH